MNKINQPKVSVLIPNLNNRAFLAERIQSILDQTFTDWELIIVDNYSDDGAWELIQKYAAQDERIKISQSPRGMYANWNNCIRLAGGQYVYIATSDDTMMPDCLEKMVGILERYPDCDLCHCCLKAIDETGKEIKGWWEKTQGYKFYGQLMLQSHIRQAPYDGILHCAFETGYLSITQLLIRRTIFDKVGLFPTDWGSKGDFAWKMRASLVCNTFHLPEVLATWRIHSEQATSQSSYLFPNYWSDLIDMIKVALPILKDYNYDLYKKIRLYKLLFIYHKTKFKLNFKNTESMLKKIRHSIIDLISHPLFFKEFIIWRFFYASRGYGDMDYIKKELNRLNLTNIIQVIE